MHTDVLQRLKYPDLGLVEHGLGLGPAARHIGRIEGLAEVPRGNPAIVADKVDLEESGTGIVPLGERADRDLVFQEGAGFGAGSPAKLELPLTPRAGRSWQR